MNANLRQLQAFVAVYRLGSLTRAAEQLCVTQPAVTVLLRQLEQVSGVRLFDRTTRSLRPTVAAHESIAKAERILKDFDQLIVGFRDVAERRRSSIAVGATPAVASSLLPPVLLEFGRRFPEIHVAIHDLAPEQLVAAVIDETVEFSVGTPDHPSADVSLTTLIQDRMCVICVRESPLARRRSIAWDEIAGRPTVSVKKGHGVRTIIDDTLGRLGVRFEPTYEVSYLATALSLTQHGLGISILPSYLTRYFHDGRLAAVRLVAPVVTRNLSLVTRRGSSLSPAAQEFVEVLRGKVRREGAARRVR